MNEEMASDSKWPREILIGPTAESVIANMGDDYNEEDDDAVGVEMGMQMEAIEICSWDELNLPEGYKIIDDDDREEYDRYLESKNKK